MTCKGWLLVVVSTVLSDAVDAGGADLARAKHVWADFDGDGLEDVYVVRPDVDDALFRNAGDGSFEDVTAQALPCVECASIEVAWRDVDLDRLPDLLRVSISGNVELLRNRGDGAFEDVTLAAGLERVSGASTARWLDYDADGRSDLEITTPSAVLLQHNLGDFLFEAVTFVAVGGTAASEGSPIVRTIPVSMDAGVEGPAAVPNAPAGDTSVGMRSVGGSSPVLTGTLSDGVHPDPLVVGTPPVDLLEPNPEVEVQFSPFGNRCAWSVKDTATGDCVLVSTEPTLGKLFPMSAELFVATSGNVGIGTTSPTATLDVAGTARISGSTQITDTLALDPSGDHALDVNAGSIYKGGALFIHSKGGAANTAIGRRALANVTSLVSNPGERNTASGYQALFSSINGDENTANGYRALFSNTSGRYNTASGGRALYSNGSGMNNTATGFNALHSNANGDGNTATGFLALYSGSGDYNTACGALALHGNSGDRNTASGAEALRNNTSGEDNTAIGSRALFWNTTGYDNTACGTLALEFNTTGRRNTASGYRALNSNTTGADNTALGTRALDSNTTGIGNTAIGLRALHDNSTGTSNTANGLRALAKNTTGNNNTANGTRVLHYNTTGAYNTASGSRALYSNTTATFNTASGFEALRYNTTGNNNTASGNRALYYNTTGARNIALGNRAGASLTTGSDNIAIGNLGVAGEGATIRIGAGDTHTRAFIAGIRGVTTGVADAIPVVVDSAGQLGTVSSSRRFKKDIADMGERSGRLLELRPVVFRYEQEQTLPRGDVSLEYGLIAEEVAEIFPDLVVYDEEGLPFTVKYHLLSSMLLNELKELAREQRGESAQLHERMEALSAAHASELEELRSRLAVLEARSELGSGPVIPVSNL